MTYTALENALVTELRTLSIYGTGNCDSDDLDGVVRYANKQEQGTDYRNNILLVDFAGGVLGAQRGMWTHYAQILCATRVEESEDHSTQPVAGRILRTAVEGVHGLLTPNNKLGGETSRCALTSIDPPIVWQVSNTMWYVCFMTVEIDEPMARC